MSQANSDPLPYVQVDRAVKPKAALLAQHLGVTTQHALGSLVEFWDLCGDPRDLERIVGDTPEGVEPAVLLDADTLALRFRLASGHDCPAAVLVALGVAAPVGAAFRVRGMSRYFEPIVRRLGARRAASVGGKRSAEARRATHGTAQPGSAVASESAQATPEARPKRTPKRARSGAEAESKPSGQRSAVSGQLQEREKALAPVELVLEPVPDEEEHARQRAAMLEAFCSEFVGVTGREYVSEGAKDEVALKALVAQGVTPEDVALRIHRGLLLRARGEFPGVASLAQLRARWNDLATPVRGEVAPARGGVVTAVGLGPPWWAEWLRSLEPYIASQFAQGTPRERGGRREVVVADEHFAAWLRDAASMPEGWAVVCEPAPARGFTVVDEPSGQVVRRGGVAVPLESASEVA